MTNNIYLKESLGYTTKSKKTVTPKERVLETGVDGCYTGRFHTWVGL